MNATPDQTLAVLPGIPSISKPETERVRSASHDPLDAETACCVNYNEEWVIFVARCASQGSSSREAEILPRVWNCPHL